jgi:hypothetical protein
MEGGAASPRGTPRTAALEIKEQLTAMSKVDVAKLAKKLQLDEDTVLDEAEDKETEEEAKAFLVGAILDEMEIGGRLHKLGFGKLKKHAAAFGSLSKERVKSATSVASDKKAAVLRLIFDDAVAQAGVTSAGSLTASAALATKGFHSLAPEERQPIVQQALDDKRPGKWTVKQPLGKGGQAMVFHIVPTATDDASSGGGGKAKVRDRAFKVVPYADVVSKGKLER